MLVCFPMSERVSLFELCIYGMFQSERVSLYVLCIYGMLHVFNGALISLIGLSHWCACFEDVLLSV